MRRIMLQAAVAAAGLTLAGVSNAKAQTTSFATTGNSTATANAKTTSSPLNTHVATSTPGQFFTGYSPVNLVQSPVNFSTPLQSGVNIQSAMRPQSQSNGVANIQSAFRNITFPLFRSTPVSTPIVQPGPNNPIQPTGLPAFHSQQQAKTKKG